MRKNLRMCGSKIAHLKGLRTGPSLSNSFPLPEGDQSNAIKSISMRTFFGRRETWTVERAGLCVVK